MELNLRGRTALITGASKGIGLACAIGFAAEGCRVHIAARSETLLEAARVQAERMVQRTEVVRAAEQRARQISEAADADSRRLRHETEDFLDQRLGSFEILLDKLQKTVHAGRSRLSIGAHRGDEVVEEDDPTKGFFDQDR